MNSISSGQKKTPEGFVKSRGFNIDFTLDIGDEKDLKALNKKVSFSGGKNGNPSSDGSYIEFVDYFTTQIIESDCLQVLKDTSFEFPEILEDEDIDNVELDETPQSFSDYPEDIQHQALQVISEGTLFQEIQKSVSLTHQGHKTTRNALILMESSLFVGDGVHGLLGGASGGGKSDLAFAIALNFPDKHVRILRNISPKNIYYDFEAYDNDFNILIFDDIPFTDDLVNLCKELTDNTKKVKELKTVINGKSYNFRLKGKYEVIITYAKTIPDEELANRLFNVGVSIVDKGESQEQVSYKIRDNNIVGGNDNLIFERNRLTIQACIHYLIEQKARVYNPFLSIFNPTNYNNRDINHFINMTKARTFFEYAQRKQIQVNEDVSITIGSYEDLNFVHEIWAKDEEAQLHKLSERQKQILDLLPEMTNNEAFNHVEDLNNKLNAQSRAYVKQIKDDEPLANSLARKLKCNVHTLKHDLDRVSEGTHKSLLEIGLVEKIKLDEEKRNSPNFYYKIKDEGKGSNPDESTMQTMKIQFAHSINSSIVKQKIIIDLLYYANIVISERGIAYIKKYCNEFEQELDVEDYNDIFDFLQGFFDDLKYDVHTIDLSTSTLEDMGNMMNFNNEIIESLQKEETRSHDPESDKICIVKEIDESSSNSNQSETSFANQDCTSLHNTSLTFKEQIEEINVDLHIAKQIYALLSKSGAHSLQEITNYICEGLDPEDFNNETTPLKIEMDVNRLYMSDYLDFNKNKYELTKSFIALARGEDSC